MSEIIASPVTAAPAAPAVGASSAPVALKEWTELRRDSRLAWLFALVSL